MRAARALAWREVVRFVRQPSRIVGAFAPPLLAWVLLGAGFGSSFRVPGGGGTSYVGYFFPGTVVLVVLFAAIFSTISVIEDRREGFLQAVVVSPASPLAVAVGKIAGYLSKCRFSPVIFLFARFLSRRLIMRLSSSRG